MLNIKTLWMFCSVCFLGCMVVSINALFAQWRITEHDYFQMILLSGWDFLLHGTGTHYLFSNIDSVTANFYVLVNTYFVNFRLALLIVLCCTRLYILFWDFLILYQIFFSPQVKRSVIISNKHGIYELPHELPNDLRLRILGN